MTLELQQIHVGKRYSMVPAKQVHMRAVQIYEFIRSNGWNTFFKEVIYRNRRAIVVEKDLSETRFREEIFRDANVEFVELHPETFSRRKISYAFKNRYLKAMYYFGRGYRGHALVRGNEVIGDIWYYAPGESNGPSDHVDLHWLGITLGLDSVYSFDIYFVPAERGKNLTAALQSSSMYALHQKGYKKAIAYYWIDNLPAVWNTRIINAWKEMKALAVSRIFLFRRIAEINDDKCLSTKIPKQGVENEFQRAPHGGRKEADSSRSLRRHPVLSWYRRH